MYTYDIRHSRENWYNFIKRWCNDVFQLIFRPNCVTRKEEAQRFDRVEGTDISQQQRWQHITPRLINRNGENNRA